MPRNVYDIVGPTVLCWEVCNPNLSQSPMAFPSATLQLLESRGPQK